MLNHGYLNLAGRSARSAGSWPGGMPVAAYLLLTEALQLEALQLEALQLEVRPPEAETI